MKVEHLQWDYGGIFWYILHECKEGQISKPTFWWTSSVCPMHKLNGGQSSTLSSAQNDLYAEHKIFYIIGTKKELHNFWEVCVFVFCLWIGILLSRCYQNTTCGCFLFLFLGGLCFVIQFFVSWYEVCVFVCCLVVLLRCYQNIT